ncbi:MAG: hypothetical protein WB566_07235 [Terriglobales bacterium]
MGKSFTVNDKYSSMAAEVVFLALWTLLVALTLSTALHAQGPALTTISGVRYSDEGWGAGYNGNLVGRFPNSSFTLTRYARSQTYFLKSYDGSGPPKYSRYSTALHVDYPLT